MNSSHNPNHLKHKQSTTLNTKKLLRHLNENAPTTVGIPLLWTDHLLWEGGGGV